MEDNEDINKPHKKKRSKSAKYKDPDHRNKSSMEAQMFKTRLHHLTGSEKIKLNDPEYRDRMRRRVWEEYQVQQDKEEKAREEAERERMRRLVTRGIIGVDELRNDRALTREYRRDNKQSNKKHSRIRKSSPQRVKSAPQTLEHKRVSFGSDEKLSSNNRRPKTAAVTGRHREMRYHDQLSVTSSVEPERVSAYTGYSSSRPSSRTSRLSIRSCRYEHPVVREMRQEESLDELYRLAEEIIPEPQFRNESAEKEMTEEEKLIAEENKYKGKKVVAKIKF